MGGKKRKVLGRGLGALLKPTDTLDKDNSGEIIHLDIDVIEANPRQPRQTINEDKLDELAKSIKAKGVIQPILVRPREKGDKKYEIVAGERRLMASKLAGFSKIPALVKYVKDEDMLEIALIENIQRDDLNPIEESKAYQRLLKEKGYTQDDLAARVGKNRSTITNLIRLLQLPKSIQNDLAANIISAGHARALLSLKRDQEQISLRNSIVSENLSVRKTEEMVRSLKQKSDPDGDHDSQSSRDTKEPRNTNSGVSSAEAPRQSKDASNGELATGESSLNITFCQQTLSKRFGANVVIKTEKDKKGKIELEFNTQEDFQRIYRLLLKKR